MYKKLLAICLTFVTYIHGPSGVLESQDGPNTERSSGNEYQETIAQLREKLRPPLFCPGTDFEELLRSSMYTDMDRAAGFVAAILDSAVSDEILTMGLVHIPWFNYTALTTEVINLAVAGLTTNEKSAICHLLSRRGMGIESVLQLLRKERGIYLGDDVTPGVPSHAFINDVEHTVSSLMDPAKRKPSKHAELAQYLIDLFREAAKNNKAKEALLSVNFPQLPEEVLSMLYSKAQSLWIHSIAGIDPDVEACCTLSAGDSKGFCEKIRSQKKNRLTEFMQHCLRPLVLRTLLEDLEDKFETGGKSVGMRDVLEILSCDPERSNVFKVVAGAVTRIGNEHLKLFKEGTEFQEGLGQIKLYLNYQSRGSDKMGLEHYLCKLLCAMNKDLTQHDSTKRQEMHDSIFKIIKTMLEEYNRLQPGV